VQCILPRKLNPPKMKFLNKQSRLEYTSRVFHHLHVQSLDPCMFTSNFRMARYMYEVTKPSVCQEGGGGDKQNVTVKPGSNRCGWTSERTGPQSISSPTNLLCCFNLLHETVLTMFLAEQ
jgi:hypothetical protein